MRIVMIVDGDECYDYDCFDDNGDDVMFNNTHHRQPPRWIMLGNDHILYCDENDASS